MAKFDRLRWIPMIMDAYNEARVRTQRSNTVSRQTLSDLQSVPTGPAAVQQDPTSPRMNNARHRLSHQATRRSLVVPHTKRSRAAIRQRSAAMVPYNSMIRELRDTKQKLRQLETIHVRLNELQSTMEQRLAELAERVSSSKASPEIPHAPSSQKSEPWTSDVNNTPPTW